MLILLTNDDGIFAPGLAALDPDGKRLLVPLVDSPFVNLVEVQSSALKVSRLPTFGGIHLTAAFHSAIASAAATT